MKRPLQPKERGKLVKVSGKIKTAFFMEHHLDKFTKDKSPTDRTDTRFLWVSEETAGPSDEEFVGPSEEESVVPSEEYGSPCGHPIQTTICPNQEIVGLPDVMPICGTLRRTSGIVPSISGTQRPTRGTLMPTSGTLRPTIGPPSIRDTVPDEYLKLPPYNSIGKIFWTSDDPEANVYWATAFYIGDNTVVSAAHNFSNPDEDAEKIISERPPTFVPAMIDKDDVMGRNYGYFFLDDVVYLHSRYQRENFSSEYDISIAKIIAGNGFFPNHLHFGNRFPCPGDFDLPLELPVRNIWRVIGYDSDSGKMTEFLGYQKESQPQMHLAISPAAYMGMSGGPWIPINGYGNEVEGIQSSKKEDENNSYSFSPTTGEIVELVQYYYEHIWGRLQS